MPHDRAGNEMRKQQNKKRERTERIDRRIVAHTVDEVGDQLEREKADADRQNQMRTRQIDSRRGLKQADQKIQILECRKRQDVQHDADSKNRVLSGPLVSDGEQPCDGNLADKQRDETDVPPSVEEQRDADQHPLAERHMPRARVIQYDGDRQKNENVKLRLKQHLATIDHAGGRWRRGIATMTVTASPAMPN